MDRGFLVGLGLLEDCLQAVSMKTADRIKLAQQVKNSGAWQSDVHLVSAPRLPLGRVQGLVAY